MCRDERVASECLRRLGWKQRWWSKEREVTGRWGMAQSKLKGLTASERLRNN